MAEKGLKLEIIPKVNIQDPDLSECRVCKETIYSKMTVVTFETNKGTKFNTKLLLCESCSDMLDDII